MEQTLKTTAGLLVQTGKNHIGSVFLVKQLRNEGLFGPFLVILGTFFTCDFDNSSLLLGNALLASVNFSLFSKSLVAEIQQFLAILS